MLTTQNPNPGEKQPFILWRPFLAAWNWLVPPTQAHIDRQSRTSRYVFLGSIVVLALVLIVTALLKGRDWHNAYKRWASNSDAREAVKYEKEANDYLEANRTMDYQDTMRKAASKANEAYLGDSDNPEAIRVLARIATRAGGTNANTARFLWEKLAKNHQMTDDDFAWRVQALANLKEDKSASDQIEKLLKDTAPTRKVVDTADQVMQRLGRVRQLLEILKNYVREQPDDFDTKLLLGIRLKQLGNDEDKKEGAAILWEMADRDDDTGLHALEFLDSQKNLTVKESQILIARLPKHPEAKEYHRIAALKRSAALPGADKQAIIDKAIVDHANSKREDLVPLSRWLLDEGEFEKLADFLKPKEKIMRDYTPLLDHYLTALTRLKRYDDLQTLVDDPRVQLKKSERAFHRVHLAYVLGKPEDELDKLLVDAVSAAINDNQIPMLLQLGRYAEQRKHYRTALDAYKAASVSALTEQEGFEGLLRVNYVIGDTKEFTNAAHETARRWPDNQRYLERSLYAGLLTGIEMETALSRCQKLYDARPNDSQRKLLMGLADIRMADPSACRRAVEGINLDDIAPGQRAVLCGLMKAMGFAKQAYELSQTIPDDIVMLPEEANFLRRAKQSPDVGVANAPLK